MLLSLSGRIVESDGGTTLAIREFLALAKRNGYRAVDLRATQLSAATSDAEVAVIQSALAEADLMLFEGACGGKLDASGECDFTKLAGRLAALKAQGMRMGGDLATLKRACRLAAPFGLKVFYQMHTGGPFETVASARKAIDEIGEPNFAVLPEPSNLLMAREKFSADMLAPLKGKIGGVHIQTIEIRPDAQQALKLLDGTEVRYERVDYEQNNQLDFATFFKALRHVGFTGCVNELEPYPGPEKLESTVAKAAKFLSRHVA